MSRAIVGRIFWKELRTLGSLWFTLATLAVVLEVVVALWFTHSRPWWAPEKMVTAAAGTLLVGYVTAMLYTIATASAMFTSEFDGTRGNFLRTVPVTRLEAFAGKWSYGLGSTAALLAAVVVIALIVSALVGLGSHTVSPGSASPRIVLGADGASDVVLDVRMGVLLPIEFFALCVLSSLLFSNVLMAAAFGTFLSILASCGWWIAPPWINTVFIMAVISADFWLTGIWLQRGPVASWESSDSELDWSVLPQLIRGWQPTAPWQRAAQSLFWKDLRQTAPFTGVAAIAVLAASLNTAFNPGVNSPPPSTMFFRWTAHWIAFLAIPLLMGLAAYHVEQRGHVHRLLGERGVPAAGSWIVKHLVWLGITSLMCFCLLVLDRVAAGWAFDGFGRSQPHRDAPDTLFNALSQAMVPSTLQGTRLPNPSVPLSTVAGTMALYVLIAYSIGQFFSRIVPKAVIAMGMGLGGVTLACVVWAALYRLGVPTVWTIGVLPVVLFTFTLSRAGRWQIGRSMLNASGRAAAWVLVPTAFVAGGIIVYRIYEIPWMPFEANLSRLRLGAGPSLRGVREVHGGALWSRAAHACVASEPEQSPSAGRFANSGAAAELNGWSNASRAEKKWLAESAAAVALAIDASKYLPTAIEATPSPEDRHAAEKWSKLASLLALSAAERESAGQLDDAFLRYQAALHLAACLSHRYETWFEGREIAIDTLRHMRGWAAHPQQTTARVEHDLLQIESLNNQTQALSVVLQAEWEKWLKSRDQLASPTPESRLFVLQRSAHPDSTRLAHPLFPWEAARDRRIVNALFKTTLLGIETAESRLSEVGWFSPDGPDIKEFEDQCVDVLSWLSTTPSMNRDQCIVAQDLLLAVVNTEARRRMELIAVVFASFRREQRHDPVSIDELLPPQQLKLCDPWTGRNFYYFSGRREFHLFGGKNGFSLTGGAALAQIAGGRSRKPSAVNPPVLISEGFARYQPPNFTAFLNRPLLTQGTESSSKITVVLNR
jgi:hypothetical protein